MSTLYRRIGGVWSATKAVGNQTPPPPANQPPAAPTGLSTTTTQSSVTLSWVTAVDPDGNLASYNVFLDGASQGTISAVAKSTTFSGLQPSTSYTLGLQAVDAGGLTSAIATTSATTSAIPSDTTITSGTQVNETNTGPRVALTPYSGDWSVARQGSPTGKDISGRILLDKAGTYRDFRARDGANASASGVVIEHFEIGPATGNGSNGAAGVGIVWGGYTARYGKIHNFSDGLRLNGGTAEYCLIYNLSQQSTSDHNDGIQITTGSTIRIVNCKIINDFNQTSCIMIGSDQGPISDALVSGCFLEIAWDTTAGYCLYPGDSGCTNVRIENVVFSTRNGKGRALYPSRPASGHLTGCTYDDGTVIPDETWG